jgi:hypothetical protein
LFRSGVAPDVELYALKVLDNNGSGWWSDVIAALQWAVDHRIHVTNNSYADDKEGNYESCHFEMGKNAVADIRVFITCLVFTKSHPQAQPGDVPLHADGLSNGFDICGLAGRAWSFRFYGQQSQKRHP